MIDPALKTIESTIVAITTPPGRGGVGIIRVSGCKALEIAEKITSVRPMPRYATHCDFLDEDGSVLDQGLALYFPNPHSFTGEAVLELHAHGSPIVLDNLVKRIVNLGAQLARPGEFSERAFLNGKIDLAQAEAIADLIDSSSQQAARSAMRSLQGEFSKRIHLLLEALTHLRMYVEAAMDFPEEEVDFLSDENVVDSLEKIAEAITELQKIAQQGVLLREGMTVVIAGPPNAGKSSLLNSLSGEDTAIVAEIPGTTRDVLRSLIQIDGLPLHIIDTAGLRETDDVVEKEGIRRAHQEINKADRVLFVTDIADADKFTHLYDYQNKFCIPPEKITIIHNKVDLIKEPASLTEDANKIIIQLSAKTGEGIALLRDHLKHCMGFSTHTEGNFIARRRHLDALQRTLDHLQNGRFVLQEQNAAELLAEELRLAQGALGEITGVFRPDELLGKIFSTFCIGK
jgi:tRNA modification GTPase